MASTYTVPLVYTAESNNTLIAKRVIRVLNCSADLIENNSCMLWNVDHCPNDKDYCNPFIVGDKIYQQFVHPLDYYQYLFLQVINVSTGLPIEGVATTEIGEDSNGRKYLNVIIDTSTGFENVSCFYTKITAFKQNEFKICMRIGDNAEDFESCVSDLMAQDYTEEEAIIICLPNICPDALQEIYSEPYCVIECGQESLLIEGYFPRHDCNGNYYAPFVDAPTTNSFIQQIRILGEVNPTDNNVEVTFVNKTVRKSAQNYITHHLRGHEKVPYYVIQKIANIFASKKTTIDGVEYNGTLKLSKNNELGKMWIIDENITTTCGEVDFSCE